MEPVSLTAAAIVSLIFSEALKEGGKALGKGVSDQIGQLLSAIRQKFQAAGTEGLLTRAQENPTEKNTAKLQDELETQMEEDQTFTARLKELMTQLRANETVNQIVLKGVKVQGKATLGVIEQEATPGNSVNQEALVDSEFGSDLNLGNIKQKG
ncbi:hypothetical protein H6S82_00790 [Planktothrix sp. FACHB-1355]|uniref:hypothetical protein n=1 Tax=Planktothrix sp. FACHB-1355 TaxID=2692854 RepID=UPI00168B2BAD|nr:hypothetical protein [Planktothrix sp. FACHB-1355]MBD3557405.1 hypothetical protein [Planktothrix sp. FACHB-1355]